MHIDVWGLAPILARNGVWYFLTLINNFLKKVWIYFLRKKSVVVSKFKVWKVEVEKEQGCSVKCLRFDNGREFTSREFQVFCDECGIQKHFIVKETPQQIRMAERMNRTILEKVRLMRLQIGLSKAF